MKILTVSDLPAGHRGADLYMAHLAQKEQLAAAARSGSLGTLGLSGFGTASAFSGSRSGSGRG